MKTYEKIETIYARDIEGTKKLVPGTWRNETVKFLKDCVWEWTEKVDGTNVRIFWDGHAVTFGGRTDNAQMPAPLVNVLNDLFGGEENAQMFEQLFGENEVILFGEGYGKKIQGVGSRYDPDGVNFILFDVLWGNNYQPRERVEKIAEAFGIECVPVVGSGPLEKAVEYVKTAPTSWIAVDADCPMEGLVCRPAQELRDRCGNRVIVKIKARDFMEG